MNLVESIQNTLKHTQIESLGVDAIFDQLINNLPDSIFIKDHNSRFIVANKAVADLMGMDSPDQLIGKKDDEVFPKELADKYRADEKEIFANGIPKLDIIEPVLYREKEMRWYSTSKVPLKDKKGNVIGVIGIGRNITDSFLEKQSLQVFKRKAEQSEILKTAFIANISHEFRTPLNGIMGLLQLIGGENLESFAYQEEIKMILDSGHRLTRLMDGIMEISLLQSNELKLNPTDFDLFEMIDPVCSAFESKILDSGKNIHFRKLINEQELPRSIYTDSKRLKQVINHLLHNAQHFTQSGEISLCAKWSPEGFMSFLVNDTGIGISPEHISAVFNPFWQADNSSTREHQGAGLGLTISKGLVKLMGGVLSIQSKESEGTEVRFRIPVTQQMESSETVSKNTV